MKVVGWVVLLGSAVAWGAARNQPTCRYEGDKFRVSRGATEFTQTVEPGFWDAAMACTPSLAAIYDGRDLHVFSWQERQFFSRRAARDYESAQLATASGTAALYDGEQLLIWQAGKFISERTDSTSYRFAKLAVTPSRVALYDGGDWWLWQSGEARVESFAARDRYSHTRVEGKGDVIVGYDGDDVIAFSNGGVRTEVARSGFPFPAIAVAGTGALLYDGKQLIGFCRTSNRFVRLAVRRDYLAQEAGAPVSGNPRIILWPDGFELDPESCQIRRL